MFTVVLVPKNKKKFVNWYCRQPHDVRALLTRAFFCFYEERGLAPNVPLLHNNREVAAYLFEDMQSFGISNFLYYPESREIVCNFHPFVFWDGIGCSEYLKRCHKQLEYENE